MKKQKTTGPKNSKPEKETEAGPETKDSPMNCLIQKINDAVVVIDIASGKYIDCNSQMEKMFGYSREQLLSMKTGDLTADRAAQNPKKFEELESGHTLSGNLQMLTAQGKAISVRYSSSPILFNEKKCTLNILRDANEEERAKKELRDMSRFPEEDPNPVLRTDEEGILLYCNSAANGLLRSWGGLFVGDMIPKDVFQKIKNPNLEKITIDAENKTYLVNIVRIPQRGYINLYGQDITELKKADELVLMLTQAVEQSSASIVITDAKGNIEYVNPWFIKTSGYSFEEIVGKNPRILKSGHTKPEEYKKLWQTVTQGKEWHGEFHNKKKNGELYWESASLSPVKNERGKITHYLAVKEDITEQKEAEKAKNAFIAIMSHELRNPLAPIVMNVQLLERYIANAEAKQKQVDPEIKESVGVISRQTRSMSRLLDDLLDISRIMHGKISLRKEVVNLSSCAKNAAETVMPIITAQKHSLTISTTPEPVLLHADPIRIEQIIVNLLNNAAKYTKQGGKIHIAVETEGNTAIVRVKDTGIGIPPANIEKIFDLFSQATRPFAETNGDFGIGLNITRDIVKLHGGTIEAVSAGIGKGSEFIVRFPIHQKEESVILKTNNESFSPAVIAGPRKVLIVDDNTDVANSLQKILTHFGHATMTANDGASALSKAAEFKPELVFLDIGLPDMTGYDVARHLREQYGKELKIVALTGFGQEKDKNMAMESGFNFHFTKPVSIRMINEVIRQCFG